jgi:hypothetical protein
MADNTYYINADLFNKLPPSYYLNRKNHVGTQPISSIDGLQEALDACTGIFATLAYVNQQDSIYYTAAQNYADSKDLALLNYLYPIDLSLYAYFSKFIKSASLGYGLYWNNGLVDVSIVSTNQDYIDGSLAHYIKSSSTGTGLYWNAGLLDVSISSTNQSYIDGSLAHYIKSSSTGYGLEWTDGYFGLDTSVFTKSYLTYFDSTGISTYYIPESTHHVGANFSVTVYESTGGGYEPLYPNVFVDGDGNLTLNWIPGSISGQVNVLLFGAGTVSTIDNSVYATIDMLKMFLKESSIGSGFTWNNGYLDVSAQGDVTKAYVDGSLALKADYIYVDGSLSRIDGSISDLYDTKLNNTTDTFTGVLTIDGSLIILGDLYQDGSTFIVNAIDINVSNNFITLRNGAITALPDGSISGLRITKPDGINDVIFGAGNDTILRIGWESDVLQAIATREDNPTDGWYTYWDDSSSMLKTYDLKGYIDSSFALKTDIESSLGLYVKKSGDTMTGNLTIDTSLIVSGKINTEHIVLKPIDSSFPRIDFVGDSSATIHLEVLENGTVAFMGNNGMLFSVVDDVSGTLLSVNNISGLPVFEVFSYDQIDVNGFLNNADGSIKTDYIDLNYINFNSSLNQKIDDVTVFTVEQTSGLIRLGDNVLNDTTGVTNSIFMGKDVGPLWDSGTTNILLGYNIASKSTTGSRNVYIGSYIDYYNNIGEYSDNIMIGHSTGTYNRGGNNIFIGNKAGNAGATYSYTTNSVIIGDSAARFWDDTSYNGVVVIGCNADETGYLQGSNKLIIDNQDRATPLIYGEFDTPMLRINGYLDVSNYLAVNTINELSSSLGITINSSLNMNNHKIYNVSIPVNSSDATNKFYVDSSFALKTDVDTSLGLYVKKSGDTMSGDLTVDTSIYVGGKLSIGTTADSFLGLGSDTPLTSKNTLYIKSDGASNIINHSVSSGGFASNQFRSGTVIWEIGVQADIINGNLLIRPSSSGNLSMFNLSRDGYMGLGTSYPVTTLDISGNLHATQNVVFDSSLYVSGDTYFGDTSTNIHTIVGDVGITGNLVATTKSFLIKHPLDPNKKLQYGNLEGPEFGVYHRGKYSSNVIKLPNYWDKLVDEKTLTVQLTSNNKWNVPYVKNINNNELVIGKIGLGKLSGYYIVYGERKDVDKLKVEK